MQKHYKLLLFLAAVAFVFPSKLKAQTLTDSLRLYISFDDSTSTDLTTKHPIFDMGTFSAVQGKIGSGFQFNGQDQYLIVNDIEDVMLGNKTNRDFSISLWFYNTDSTNNKIRPLIGRILEESKNTDYVIFLENSKLYWGTGISTDSCAWSRIAEPSRNAWHHIVVTYSTVNGTTGAKEIYLDNSLVKTCNFTEKADPTSARLTIGSMMSGATGNREFFKGILDEIRIYNRKLSGTEVAKLYNPTSSIHENIINQNLQVYPNPVKDQLTIQLPENVSGCKIELINALGQSVFITGNVSSSHELKLNVSQLERGIYLVKVSDRKAVYLSKIIKE